MEESAKNDVDEVVRNILHNAGFFPQRPPLFHYTNAPGFEGIISTNVLWATNAKFLNDASEVRYGRELGLPLLRSRCEAAAYEPWREVLGNAQALLGDKNSPVSDSVLAEFTDAYVVCFCEGDDLLSQWRTYGAAGGGYSMEFNISPSSVVPSLRCRQIFVAPVRYERKKQGDLLSDLLDKVEKEVNDREAGFLAMVLDLILSAWLYTVKDGAFQSEREWRLVLLPSVDESGYLDYGNLLFRSSQMGPIPFIEVRQNNTPGGNSKLPLVGVKCGPNIAHEAVEHAVRLLLKKHGFLEAAKKASSSTIPVRRT